MKIGDVVDVVVRGFWQEYGLPSTKDREMLVIDKWEDTWGKGFGDFVAVDVETGQIVIIWDRPGYGNLPYLSWAIIDRPYED